MTKTQKIGNLHFTEELLRAYGCENCIWKENHQCPYKEQLNEKGIFGDGYCGKLVNFLNELSEGEDSISAVKEKFHLFIQEMQALTDRKDYLKAKEEYEQAEIDGMDPKDLAYLYGKLSSYKTWWIRVSESVVKGLGRIADREQKTKSDTDIKINVQQFGKLLKESKRRLEER